MLGLAGRLADWLTGWPTLLPTVYDVLLPRCGAPHQLRTANASLAHPAEDLLPPFLHNLGDTGRRRRGEVEGAWGERENVGWEALDEHARRAGMHY